MAGPPLRSGSSGHAFSTLQNLSWYLGQCSVSVRLQVTAQATGGSLTLMPEWYFLLLSLSFLTALRASWKPLFWLCQYSLLAYRYSPPGRSRRLSRIL